MRLATPVYQTLTRQERVLNFKGYNKKSVIDDGEIREMKNLSSDEHPCLYQRKPRGIYTYIDTTVRPEYLSMMSKDDKLAVIGDDGNFYYDGELVIGINGLTEDTQMVAINTKICFFPDKKYYDVKSGRCGNLEVSFALDGAGTVIVTSSSITFPEGAGVITGFAAGDTVTCVASDVRLNISAEIINVTEHTITFPRDTFLDIVAEGEDEASVTLTDFSMSRSCPDLDFVIEANNRLWGVSNKDNTIYACKLGDPTNWQYFQTTNMDSYYAEQGTDGEWTGCAAYSGHLLFFKEDYIHKVYGSKPSEYQIETAKCHALEKGSGKSIAIINETVLYKSRLGIMAYAGGTPFLISENFGSDKYTNAVAGTDGMKYYVSAEINGKYEMMVYDMEKFLWHKEDDTKVRDFCYHNGRMLFINDADGNIYEMASDKPYWKDTPINWMAQFGPFDEFAEDKKVYSKVKMRMSLEKGSIVYVYISIDDGEWEHIETITSARESSQLVPVVPRRCNKFSVKLEGVGYCKVESMVREYRLSTSRRDVR